MGLSNASEPESEIYEDRYLAFIDILGFSNLVRSSENDPALARRLLKQLREMTEMFVNKSSAEFGASLFSDTVCFSAKGGHPIAFCLGLSAIAAAMLGQGYPVRGSLVRGKLYHQGSIIFGPAVLRAYDLERKLAFYPRIVVDPTLLLPLDSATEPFQPLLKDQDGVTYLNTLSPLLMALFGRVLNVPFNAKTAGFDERVAMLLQNAQDEAARQKLQWLMSFVRRSIDGPQPDEATIDRYHRLVLAEMDRSKS